MTYLQLVNKVLKRLRKAEVATSSETSYSALVGDFVEQALREVENAWDWNRLRTTVQITTSDGNYNYSLTGIGPNPKILDVFNDTSDQPLQLAPTSTWMTQKLLQNNQPKQSPRVYDVNGVDANDLPVVNLWPIPDGVYNVNFNVVDKTEIAADSDDIGNTYDYPVYLRALMHAIEERGDDGGLSLTYLQDQYTKHLGDAIAYDVSLHENETVWYAD